MIALYPMLVSNTISRNIIPGIAKVLENYLIVYGMTDIMRRARGEFKKKEQGFSSYQFKKRLTIHESEDPLADYMFQEIMFEQSQIYNQTGKGSKGKQTQRSLQTPKGQTQYQQATGGKAKSSSQAFATAGSATAHAGSSTSSVGDVTVNIQKDKEKAKDASVAIGAFDMKSISLEPTWMKTDIIMPNGTKTSGIVGVKVVPYPVKSDAKLAHLLMYDRQVNNLQGLVIRRGRAVENFFYRAWKVLWKIATLGVGGGPAGGMGMTGDPKHDILARRTILKAREASDIFVCVNQADLSDDFYASANGILNLFRMGWSSIIIVDEVNRRVSFCMKQLRGMCSIMPYTMLYQTYQQAKVYEDLEDAKRSASSIFKVKRQNFSKIVGEGYAQNKIEEFGLQNLPLYESDAISEMTYLDESISSFMRALTPAKVKTTFINLLRGNTKGMPNVDPETLVKAGSKANPNFKKSYMLAQKVLANTAPDVNKKVVDLAAIQIASASTIDVTKDVGKDIIVSTKDRIKRYIKNYRKNKEGSVGADKMPLEHYASATLGWVALLGGMGVAITAYVKLLQPLIPKIPGALNSLVTTGLPKARDTVTDMVSGGEGLAKSIKDWNVADAPANEIGLFVVIAFLASGALLMFLNSRR